MFTDSAFSGAIFFAATGLFIFFSSGALEKLFLETFGKFKCIFRAIIHADAAKIVAHEVKIRP